MQRSTFSFYDWHFSVQLVVSGKLQGLFEPGVSSKSDTPVLDNFGNDITKAAEEGALDPIVGRDREIERLAQILSRRKKNNPVLIGDPGVGNVELMSEIVAELTRANMSDQWIMRHIGMDRDELLRLKQITGLADLFADKEFSLGDTDEDSVEEMLEV